MAESKAEIIARIFYETMYPGKSWSILSRDSSTSVVLMKAGEKAVTAISMSGGKAVYDLTTQWPADYMALFWANYPHKIGKGAAFKSLEKVHNSKDRPSWELLTQAIMRYIATKPEDRPWCNPSTWLNQKRWDDEPGDPVSPSPTRPRQGGGFARIAAMED